MFFSLVFGLLMASPSVNSDRASNSLLLTRYMAKEYCSCRYIVKQTPKVCRNENKTFPLIFRLKENEQEKIIVVKSFGNEAKARFIDESHGCLLDPLLEN